MNEQHIWDRCVADYARRAGETSDDGRILRAVRDCAHGVLYFPKGVYTVEKMITADNCCSCTSPPC